MSNNSGAELWEAVLFSLATFGSMVILNSKTTDANLKVLINSFSDCTYGYVVQNNNGSKIWKVVLIGLTRFIGVHRRLQRWHLRLCRAGR